MRLERPLCCVDLETTGMSFEQDRIIQLAVIRVSPDGEELKKETLIDPGIAIPHETTLHHKISNEMVAGAPRFGQVARSLADFLAGSDYFGYNVKFDLRFLEAEFRRAGVEWSWSAAKVVDPLRIWQVREPRDLSAFVERFLKRKHKGAHNALADIEETLEGFGTQAVEFALPETVEELHALCWPVDPVNVDADGKIKWRNREAVLGFGKHNGKALKDPDIKGYLQWMAGPGSSFSPEVKAICQAALDGKFPVKDA